MEAGYALSVSGDGKYYIVGPGEDSGVVSSHRTRNLGPLGGGENTSTGRVIVGVVVIKGARV